MPKSTLGGSVASPGNKVAPIDNTANNGEQSSIYYLDANNLYGGAMHRMMPYELVGVPERREIMERINRDPNGWVQSLKTFR